MWASLVLRSRAAPNDPADILKDQDDVRGNLFALFGVILPTVQYQNDQDTPPGRLEMRLNGRTIASREWSPDSGVVPILSSFDLKSAASEFVTPGLVEHYLHQVSEIFPDLVAVARVRFAVDELTGLLRARVQSGRSIRDFRGALEDVLTTVTP